MRASVDRLWTWVKVGAVRRANRLLGRRGFALITAGSGETEGSEAVSLLLGMSRDRPISMVVVGAGLAGPTSDPGVRFLQDHPDRVRAAVLVEPIPERANALAALLSGVPAATVVPCGVGADGAKALTLWETDAWAEERLLRRTRSGTGGRSWTSGSRDHVARHLASALRISVATAMAHVIPREVPLLPLTQILTDHGVNAIDYLQVDTEGFDDEVIRSLDLAHHRPGFIRFERIHLGVDRLAALDAHLQENGYRRSHNSGFDSVYALQSTGGATVTA